ncbi:MAG TPA: hypothetical protein VNX21_09125, partial [Candidatus Thermoplasmatota archaeon]|nr:hypothetical protein [Candidatus Thermoplasmatota archaeon]
VPLRLASAWPGTPEAQASVRVTLGTLGEPVREGDRVTLNHVGLLPDGRVFDATLARAARDPDQPRLDSPGGFDATRPLGPVTLTLGRDTLPGYTALATRGRLGETVVGRVAAADAYPEGNMYQNPLVGRELVYEVELLGRA